jgi:hypothetical protein
MTYYKIKEGGLAFQKLVLEIREARQAAKIAELSAEELNLLKRGYDQMQEVRALGKAKGMPESAIERWAERWVAKHPGGEPAFNDLLAEIRNWTPEYEAALRKAEAGRGTLAALASERADIVNERLRLIELQRNPATKTAANGQRIRELEQELAANKSTSARFELDQPALEQEVADLSSSLYDRLRKAKIPDNLRADVLKGGVDRVGTLKVPPTGVTIDHIVSVKEFSEMEGVQKLLPKERLGILNNPKNLVAMDSAANSARQETRWAQWSEWSRFYADANTQANMIIEEAKSRQVILDMIAEKLKARK